MVVARGGPPSFKPWGPQLIRQEQEPHFQSSIKPEPLPGLPFLGFMALCGNESLCHRSGGQHGDTRMLPRGGGARAFHSKAKLRVGLLRLFLQASFCLAGPLPPSVTADQMGVPGRPVHPAGAVAQELLPVPSSLRVWVLTGPLRQ